MWDVAIKIIKIGYPLRISNLRIDPIDDLPTNTIQWELQDPKMEVLYHTRPYFVGICPYIGLKNRPYIYGRYLQLGRFLSHGHWCPYETLDFRWVNPQTIRHRVGTTIANYTIIDYALVIPYHIIIWYNMQV